MALVTVEHKHPVSTNATRPGRLVKVLEPFQTRVVVRPTILGYLHDLIRRDAVVLVPGREVESACDAKKRRHNVTVCCSSANHRSPFPIARLNDLWFGLPIRACDNHYCADNAHHKARLVEVVEIGVLNPILCPHIRNQAKPRAQRIGIFQESPLVVVGARETRAELYSSCNKAVSPALSDASRVTLCRQQIRDIFNVSPPRRKSSGI